MSEDRLFDVSMELARTQADLANAMAEIERLRTALADLLENVGGHGHWDAEGTHGANCRLCCQQFEAKERARRALEGK